MWLMRRAWLIGIGVVLVLGAPIGAAIALKGGGSKPEAIPAAPASQASGLPPGDAIVLAQQDGNNAVTLAADAQEIRVTVYDGQAQGVSGLNVSVAGAATTSCGRGCYEARTAARGAVPVVVGSRRLVFDVPRTAPDATPLVAYATRAFHSLRNVTYVERLASSVRDHIVTTWTLEAPNRVQYFIHGGAAGIVIGTRRWDRDTGTWTESQTDVLPQPVPIWGSTVTNAHVLSRTAKTVVVSFLNPDTPAWFDVRFDARTMLPRRLDMIAAAHFMHDRYVVFNGPRKVFPPR